MTVAVIVKTIVLLIMVFSLYSLYLTSALLNANRDITRKFNDAAIYMYDGEDLKNKTFQARWEATMTELSRSEFGYGYYDYDEIFYKLLKNPFVIRSGTDKYIPKSIVRNSLLSSIVEHKHNTDEVFNSLIAELKRFNDEHEKVSKV